jgi:hypothetical protein
MDEHSAEASSVASLAAASASGSLPSLPEPARPARYYCNKCGAYPTSEVHMAFRPTLSIRCHYLAAELEPATFTADQMRAYAALVLEAAAKEADGIGDDGYVAAQIRALKP